MTAQRVAPESWTRYLASRADGTCQLVIDQTERIRRGLVPLVESDPAKVRDVLDDVCRALAILEHSLVVLAREAPLQS